MLEHRLRRYFVDLSGVNSSVILCKDLVFPFVNISFIIAQKVTVLDTPHGVFEVFIVSTLSSLCDKHLPQS